MIRSVNPPVPTGDATARYERLSHGGATWHDLMPTPANGTDSTALTATITGISTSLPGLPGVVTTAAPHGLANDTRVLIYGVTGMTAVNNTLFTVKTAAATTFELYTAENVPVPFDTSGLPAYTGGGVASQGVLSFPYYDGTSYVTIGTPAKLNFTDPFTICVWALQDIVTPPIQSSEGMITRDDMSGGGRDVAFNLKDDNGQLTFAVFNPSGSPVSAQSGALFRDAAWHYFVGVNEGAGNDVKLYGDGALITTIAGDGGPVTWAAGTDWFFGRNDRGGAEIALDFFQGMIDTGRFYSRALSADEILRDYYAGKPAHP